jgi:hypothetical protein
LKIAWFSPVTGDGEAIEYSRWVLGPMAELCEPRLCCTDPPDRFPREVPVVDLAAEPEALCDLGPLDAVFYVLGNDLRQHAWIFEMARRHPGIVVLLDPTVHRFFLDYYLQHLQRPDLYITRMAEHYGLEGLTAAHRILGPSFDPAGAQVENADLLRYTFTEEALRSARAAVVHSREHDALARQVWDGSVYETWRPGAAEMGSGADRSALKYVRGLLRFAERHSLHGAIDYFAQSASHAVAERIATQIGQMLGAVGANPGSDEVEAIIAETSRLLSPPVG